MSGISDMGRFVTHYGTGHLNGMSHETIIRRELLRAPVGHRSVSTVDVREIAFAPGQQTGRHYHPCPVVGYIAEGAAVLQIEGHEPQFLSTGTAFHEPAQAVIARFDNASRTAPLKFIAYYLLNGHESLIEMLPDASEVSVDQS